MFDRVLIGRYIQGDSIIHQLDPRTKLLMTFYLIILIFIANNWAAYALLIAFVLFAVYLSHIQIGFYLKGIRPMIWLLLFTVVFQVLFTIEGEVYFQYGLITITSGGLANGVQIFIRLVLIIMVSTLLTLTTSPLTLTDGIESLLRPFERFGFPAHEIALMMSIALRYVPTLLEEAQKIMNAQQSRGVEFDQGNIIQRVKAFIPILIPLFVSAFNRADEMANAMEARGYRGGEGRTKYRILHFGRADWMSIGAVVLLTGIIVSLNYYR